jgi:hypothetical protein
MPSISTPRRAPRASAGTDRPHRVQPDRSDRECASVLVLSSSLLIDRMYAHTAFLAELSRRASVEVWATSAANPAFRALWEGQPARVREFPTVRPFRETAHNFPRSVNDAAWDHSRPTPSRRSLARYRGLSPEGLNANHLYWARRLAQPAGRLFATLRLERAVERAVHGWLGRYDRSPQALTRLQEERPAAVFTTGPFQFEQPAVVAAAKRLGIPTIALIPSWDNLTTKRRMLYEHDGYVVWSEEMRRQLLDLYPHAADRPIYVVGAPQFDVFFQPRYHRTREEFWPTQGLRPDRPVIVYAIGSPNFLAGEPHGALAVARAIAAGELGDVQLLVRPHPIHDNAEMEAMFAGFGPSVRLQRTAKPGTPLTARSQDDAAITDWVNTFRHADVVVNLASTCTIDAALCDRPVVNLDFDPGPGAPDQALVQEINHVWTHFKPVAESGGVWLARDPGEVVRATRAYLADPGLHAEGRRWIVRHVCEYADGRCGHRMAEAVWDFARGGRASSDSRRARPAYRARDAQYPRSSAPA